MAAWAAFRERLQETLRPTPFVLGAVAGLFLAWLGPFQTDQTTVAQRIVYWPGVLLAGTLLGVVASAAVDAVIDRQGRRPWLCVLVTAFVMTPPATLGVLVATRGVFGPAAMPGGLLALAGPVFLLSLAMNGLNLLAERRRAAPAPAISPLVEVRFLDRLPPRLRGAELHAVAAEDHYLRLHTSKGSDLILMRLSDAIAELDGLDGAQTHRSWWVARAAVVEVRRGDGRAVLILPAGVEAPVSRSYASTLRSAGWF
jgi:hypothetical protein